MKFPFATLALSALLVGVYLFFSGGGLYLTNETVSALAAQASSPTGFVTHLFIHIGPQHLVGNVLPLLLFGIVLESVAAAFDVAVIFFLAGVTASLVFALTSPGVNLVGASAGVAGLMGAAAVCRPKHVIALLFVLPALIYLVFFPFLSQASFSAQAGAVGDYAAVQSRVDALVKENRTQEAQVAMAELDKISREKALLSQGIQREVKTPTDLLVHVYGAVVGIAYLFLRRRDLADAGGGDFEQIASFIGNLRRHPAQAK